MSFGETMLLKGSIIPSNSAAGGRVEVGYASNTPSQFDGRNVGGLTRRMRRVGRLSPKQFRNLARRRVFALSSDGISLCRNHVEHVDYVFSWSSELELESGIVKILTRTRISNSNLRLQLNLVNLVNPV